MQNVKSLPEPQVEDTPNVHQLFAGVHFYDNYEHNACPPHWSYRRDRWLREQVTNNSWLASANSNVVKKLYGLGFEIIAKSQDVASHIDQAEQYNTIFKLFWQQYGKQWLRDFLTQDNGAFFEILDAPENVDTPADQPRIGFGGLRHWDSARVTRKGDPEFPVTVKHTDNKQYKLHSTRVLSLADDPSGKLELLGVGYSAVSRAVDFFTDLAELRRTLKEYYGDAIPEELWVGKSPKRQQWLSGLIEKANEKRGNDGNKNVNRRAHVELRPDETIEIIKSRVLPEHFDQETTILLAMKGIASAYGVGLRDIWDKDATGLGGKGDAEVVEHQTQGKLIATFCNDFITLFNTVVLPPYLEMIVSVQDSEQDDQRSQIRQRDVQTACQAIECGLTDVRTERELSLASGHLTRERFEALELADGRLPNGDPIETLWYSNNPLIMGMLDFDGVDSPLIVADNDNAAMISLITERIEDVLSALYALDGRQSSRKQPLRQIHRALVALLDAYQENEQPTGEIEDSEEPADIDDETKAIKAIDDESARYEAKLNQVTTLLANGTIDEEEAENRLFALAAAMIVIGFLDGKYGGRRGAMTDDEADLFDAALALLNNGGYRRATMTEAQRRSFNRNLATATSRADGNQLDAALTRDEVAEIVEGQTIHRVSAAGLTRFVTGLVALNGGRFVEAARNSRNRRVRVWVDKLREWVFAGRMYDPRNPRLTWRRGGTIEPCDDCLRYDGQTRTSSEWRELYRRTGHRPRSSRLECGGWNCQCRFVAARSEA